MKTRLILKKRDNSKVINFHAIRQVLLSASKVDYEGWGNQLLMEYIKIEDNRIMASNGHLLTIADLPSGIYSPGFYVVVKNTKSIIDLIMDNDCAGEFPNVKNIIDAEYLNQKDLMLSGYSRSSAGLTENWTKIIRNMADNVTLDFDLFKTIDGAEKVVISGAEQPIVFHGQNFKTYMMPMHIGKLVGL